MQDASELKQFLSMQKPMLLGISDHSSSKQQLLDQAAALANPDQMVMRLKGRSNLHPTRLTQLLSNHWAVKLSQPHHRLNETLNEIIHCLGAQQQSCILLIEHAHLLPISVLAALCYLGYQQEERKQITIRMILTGLPSLAPKINALYLKKYARPEVLNLSDQSNTSKKARDKNRSIITTLIQNHSIKTIAVITLCISGLTWWELQPSLAHLHTSMHAELKQPAHKDSLTLT